MAQKVETPRRAPLSKEKVLRAAVALADESGLDALSMRKLADELDVVPMALYKHVANKDQLLDGMIDVVVGEIDPPATSAGWKTAIRQRILSARRVLRRHPWAWRVLETRSSASPVVLDYMNSMIGIFLTGGFSVDLTHHVMHAMGSRLLGFSQELFDDSASMDPEMRDAVVRQMEGRYPHIAEVVKTVYHDAGSVVGPGCDDQFEFEFALDLLLDGLQSLRQRGWTSTDLAAKSRLT